MKASYHKNAAALALLAERWPKCFSVYQQRRRPLKIGIRDDIMLGLAGTMTPGELNSALRCYAANRHYQLVLRAGAVRVDLEGNAHSVLRGK
jgi:ProP effector